MVRFIYCKFKFFVTPDCVQHVTEYTNNSSPNKKGYKNINNNLRDFIDKATVSKVDCKIPKTRKSPLWDSIVDEFTWIMVSEYIEKMELIGINFEDDPLTIRKTILSYIEKNGYETRVFFKKLHDRIFRVIWENTCQDMNLNPEITKQDPMYFKFYQSELSVC